MLIIGGLLISVKSPLEINRKIPTTQDSLPVHPDEIEGALLLGTGIAWITHTFSIPAGSFNSEAGVLWQPKKKGEGLKMKKLYPYFCLIFVLALVVPAYAENPHQTGNGAFSGPHYNLNIIGVPKDKSADMDGNSGHRIFVKLDGKSKILLCEGEEFRVLDANGTKGSAKFQLPNPDPDGDGVTVYSVWARALGKPGGSADMTTCAYVEDEVDPTTLVEVCSVWVLELERKKGGSKFSNASELLYVYADLDGDGTFERYPLFDEELQGYFWDYENHGLKLAQFRFYEMPANVNQ
jgi:hypothetical protein